MGCIKNKEKHFDCNAYNCANGISETVLVISRQQSVYKAFEMKKGGL
jgi:hypothetical protein